MENLFKSTSLMRVAMLLYHNGTNGIKKKNTILRKIIEAIFIELDNLPLDENEIFIHAKNMFHIDISISEINIIIEKEKSSKYFERKVKQQTIKFCLTEQRFKTLKDTTQYNIEYYIDKYIDEKGLSISSKNIIYKFIYNLFNEHIENFSNILGKNISIDDTFKNKIPNDEISIIKSFLEWDNAEKDNAIATLIGCSLEYSMLACDKTHLYGSHLQTIFSNKILYLDTNVIFYSLGINGNDRKIANESLLNKCLIANQTLRITKYTDQEFLNTLTYYIKDIKKYETATLPNINYRKYLINEDIYTFYLEWKKARKKYNTPDYFHSYLLTEYNNWKKRYKIHIDNNIPYDETEHLTKDKLKKYTEELLYNGTINYDAKNVLWIEKLREKNNSSPNFTGEKYFFLSHHIALTKWDKSHNQDLQLIVTPDIWMMLLCRFVSRSDDDFKSFVKFINITSPSDDYINNRKFYTILHEISETVDDIETQKYILDVMVQDEFEYLYNYDTANISCEEITSKTNEKVNNILANRVDYLENKLTKQENNFYQHLENELKKQEKKNQKDIQTTKENADSDKMQAAERFANKYLLRKRIVYGCISFISAIFVIHQLINFLLLKKSNIIFFKFIKFLLKSTPLENSMLNIFTNLCGTILLLGIIPLIKFTIKLCFSYSYKQSYINDKINEYLHYFNN